MKTTGFKDTWEATTHTPGETGYTFSALDDKPRKKVNSNKERKFDIRKNIKKFLVKLHHYFIVKINC